MPKVPEWFPFPRPAGALWLGRGCPIRSVEKSAEDEAVTVTIRPFAPAGQGAEPPYLHADYAGTVKRAPSRAPLRIEQTLSEVTGPVFAGGSAGPDAADLTRRHVGAPLGERIIGAGCVLDEDARPVPGTLVELWQCNAAGRYRHPVDQHDAPRDPNFRGFGRVSPEADGRFRLATIKPGPVLGPGNAQQAPHILIAVFARGLLNPLYTRIYFADEKANEAEPGQGAIDDPAARKTLLAERTGAAYRFDIVLQGAGETAFFEF